MVEAGNAEHFLASFAQVDKVFRLLSYFLSSLSIFFGQCSFILLCFDQKNSAISVL